MTVDFAIAGTLPEWLVALFLFLACVSFGLQALIYLLRLITGTWRGE